VSALPDHTGETCVIIGNGPSLKTVPDELLRKYPSFGCNYINRLPFYPTYYTCIDSTVLCHNAGEIYNVAAMARHAFISSYILPNPLLDRLRSLPNHIPVGADTFVFDCEKYMSGNTAVYVALKIAFFMGFKRALLVGVDHTQSFEHFDPSYPQAKNPNMEGMRYHFTLAQTIYSENGREIINLSPPSELDKIFTRGNMRDYVHTARDTDFGQICTETHELLE